MREQEMLKMQMQTAYRTGDHETAEKIAARLMPDEVREVGLESGLCLHRCWLVKVACRL